MLPCSLNMHSAAYSKCTLHSKRSSHCTQASWLYVSHIKVGLSAGAVSTWLLLAGEKSWAACYCFQQLISVWSRFLHTTVSAGRAASLPSSDSQQTTAPYCSHTTESAQQCVCCAVVVGAGSHLLGSSADRGCTVLCARGQEPNPCLTSCALHGRQNPSGNCTRFLHQVAADNSTEQVTAQVIALLAICRDTTQRYIPGYRDLACMWVTWPMWVTFVCPAT